MTFTRATAILALITLGPTCLATPTDWEAGSQAYADGNYELALHFFQSAKHNGLDGPAVHYNLAVCNFKLGRYDQSRADFQQVADRYPEMRGLAEYNLGLIARRQRDTETAVNHFVNAYRLSPYDMKLRIMASNRLRELGPELNSVSKWTGAVGLRGGYDDNVALRDETGLPSALTTASPYADFFASIKGPYNDISGMRLVGSVFIVNNFDADEFDQAELHVGALYEWRSGDWQLQYGLHGSAGFLGGNKFDRKFGADFQAIRSLNQSSDLGFSYKYDDVRELDDRYVGIAGSRQQLQARYRWYSNDRQFILRYRQEENSRSDPQVSPQRKLLTLDYRYQPASGWGYEGGVGYRSSRFTQMQEPRDEDLAALNLAITRSINQHWLLLIDYQFSKNDSTDPLYTYNRNVISFAAMRVF